MAIGREAEVTIQFEQRLPALPYDHRIEKAAPQTHLCGMHALRDVGTTSHYEQAWIASLEVGRGDQRRKVVGGPDGKPDEPDVPKHSSCSMKEPVQF